MKNQQANGRKRVIGRVSRDTKGHPGIFMEAKGIWDGQSLGD